MTRVPASHVHERCRAEVKLCRCSQSLNRLGPLLSTISRHDELPVTSTAATATAVGGVGAAAALNITVLRLGESDGVAAQPMMNIHYAAGSRSPVTQPHQPPPPHHAQDRGLAGGKAIRTFHLSHIADHLTTSFLWGSDLNNYC